MDSTVPKVQCQAALALRNLASDEKYQVDIVRAGGLPPLFRLLQSSYTILILSAVACIRNISIHPYNESPIIEEGFLKPLVDLLGTVDNEEIQCHAISTLRNLAASSDRNKELVLQAGAVQKCKNLVLRMAVSVQAEMTAAIAVLALSDELKAQLLRLGIFDVLIPLTASENLEVQGNSAAALGNLSSKGESALTAPVSLFQILPPPFLSPTENVQLLIYCGQSAITPSSSKTGQNPKAASTATSRVSSPPVILPSSTSLSGHYSNSSSPATRGSST